MTYHIFNGDALKDRLAGVFDNVIVARECLVDGPVAATQLDLFWGERADFLSKHYGGTVNRYFEEVVPEFEQLLNLPEDAKVYLWFEDDLFCQVNFWFVCHLLYTKTNCKNIYYVRPDEDNRYGFGWMSKESLMTSFSEAVRMDDVAYFADLWPVYQKNDWQALSAKSKTVDNKYLFVAAAIDAHLARIPSAENPGRPVQCIEEIMEEFPEANFAKVFQEFCKRLPIYGFGDLQVKRLWDGLQHQD